MSNFRDERSNRYSDIAIFVIFKMTAAAILDIQKFEILTVSPLKGAKVRDRAKFYLNWRNGCVDIAI